MKITLQTTKIMEEQQQEPKNDFKSFSARQLSIVFIGTQINFLRYTISPNKDKLISTGRVFIDLFSSLEKEGKPTPARERQEYLNWIKDVKFARPYTFK